MTPRLTASGLWRIEACPASAVLPHKEKKYRDAQRGAREHEALEASAPPGSTPEAAFAFNVLSGSARYLGSGIKREYGELTDGEIPTTLDLLQIEPDHLFITEYKTGVGYMQAAPPINPQIQCQAIAAATYHKKDRAIVQLIYTKTGEVKDAEFDALDFAAIHERLLSIRSRVRAAEAALALNGDLISAGLIAEGPHCWRCPAEKACPLKHPQRRTA